MRNDVTARALEALLVAHEMWLRAATENDRTAQKLEARMYRAERRFWNVIEASHAGIAQAAADAG